MFDVRLHKIRLIATALSTQLLLMKNGHTFFLYSQTIPILFINQHLSTKVIFYKHELREKTGKHHTSHTVPHSKTLGQKCVFFLKLHTHFHTYLLDGFAELLSTYTGSDRRHCIPQIVLMTWCLSTFFNHRAVCKWTHAHFLFTVKLPGTGKGTEKTLLALHPQHQACCPVYFELSLGICQLTRALTLPAVRRQNNRGASRHGEPLVWTEQVYTPQGHAALEHTAHLQVPTVDKSLADKIGFLS